MNAETFRLMLTGYLVAMFVLAMLYLRRRPLTRIQFAAWGLFALLIPALGPFLVILARPGNHRKRADIVRARRKSWSRRSPKSYYPQRGLTSENPDDRNRRTLEQRW
jgi:hypothetical protein